MRLLFSLVGFSNREARFVFLSLLFVVVPTLAQEGAWSLSGSAGYAYISLGDVKSDLSRDVDGYNAAGHQLPQFPSISPALALTGRIDYRYERDYTVSLSVLHGSRRVESAYQNAEHSLSLSRTVGSTAVMLGIAQHFSAGPDADGFAEVQLGMLFASATSSIDWIRTYKLTDTSLTYITEIQDDTRGTFKKSKLAVAIAFGGSVSLMSPFILRGEALYRFAKIGKIDGTTTKFGLRQDQTTSIDFDFSGFALTIGLGIELNR